MVRRNICLTMRWFEYIEDLLHPAFLGRRDYATSRNKEIQLLIVCWFFVRPHRQWMEITL